MIKRVLVVLCLAASWSLAAGLYAQAASQTEPKPAAGMKEEKTVTLTGCLREISDQPNTFVLTDAKASATMPATEPAAGTPKEKGKTYRLVGSGGANLKEHAGHQVQIAGTITPAKDEPGATVKTEKTTVTSIDVKAAPQLNITSFKHMSATCPSAP